MAENVSQFILRRLHEEWDVDRIYGYPGDGINGLLGAFHEHGDKIEFIQTRHEELAAFMACARAKLTGDVGVCMATSGPGAIHLLNGLDDAKLDQQPVVAIVGQQKTISLGANYQQDRSWRDPGRGRRLDADERDQLADRRCAPPHALERPAPDRARPQQ
jgi:pyruvate dehydrogenase (quinone)